MESSKGYDHNKSSSIILNVPPCNILTSLPRYYSMITTRKFQVADLVATHSQVIRPAEPLLGITIPCTSEVRCLGMFSTFPGKLLPPALFPGGGR